MDQGQQIGHYTILRPLGKGGMGEVYLAQDTKLDRQVAIKVLPETLRADPERLARFRREAKAAASLQHPNIATIHSLEDDGDTHFIVMEYVDGETLSDVIPPDGLDIGGTDGGGGGDGRGTARRAPTVSFFDIFIPLADALAHAHQQGRVHRDIKPGNIMIAKDGTPKILDFGLARIIESGDGIPGQQSEAKPPLGSEDETRTLNANELNKPIKPPSDPSAMSPGPRLMGTPQYMSPEQAESETLDHRTDIFSFGVVMYEALTGRKAFEGKSRQSLLGRIINEQPEPAPSIKPVTPYLLWHTIESCLRKERTARTQTAYELYNDLKAVQQDIKSGTVLIDASTHSALRIPHSALPLRPVYAVAFALLLGSLTATLAWLLKPSPEPPLRKFEWAVEDIVQAAISPDGARIAYLRGTFGNRTLWVRDLDQTIPREVPNTEDVFSIFWSPESDFIGYWTGASQGGMSLWKVSAQGGPGIPVCTIPKGQFPQGSAWGANGHIVFSSGRFLDKSSLYEVSAQGGEPQVFLHPDSTRVELGLVSPHFLRDGRTLLFTVRYSGDSTAVEQAAQRYTDSEDQGFVNFSIKRQSIISHAIGVYVEGTERRLLDLPGDFIQTPVYAMTGHLLFRHLAPSQNKNLWAVPFNPATVSVTGDRFLVAANSVGRSVSSDGTLVYRSATESSYTGRLALVDRTGTVLDTIGRSQREMFAPALSPDEKHVAVVAREQADGDIWVHDVERGTTTRLTFDPESDIWPTWSSDGRSILFASGRNGNMDIFMKRADGTGSVDALVISPEDEYYPDQSRDGQYLVYMRVTESDPDLWYTPMTSERTLSPFLATPHQELHAALSPDGRYVAYDSDESGRREVYVRPFPEGDSRWQVSVNGGGSPRWNAAGTELFFVGEEESSRELMEVPVQTQPVFLPGTPKLLFTGEKVGAGGLRGLGNKGYDVSADGQRFVVVQDVDQDQEIPKITVVQFKDRE